MKPKSVYGPYQIATVTHRQSTPTPLPGAVCSPIQPTIAATATARLPKAAVLNPSLTLAKLLTCNGHDPGRR